MPEAPETTPGPTTAPNRPETFPRDRDPATGQWVPGNAGAARHLQYTERDLSALDAEVGAFLAGAVADDGGPENIPTRRAAALQYRARLHRRITQLDNALERYGLFDKRNKMRLAWLGMLGNLIDRARSLDAMLGLDRKARAVSLTERLVQAASARREELERDPPQGEPGGGAQ